MTVKIFVGHSHSGEAQEAESTAGDDRSEALAAAKSGRELGKPVIRPALQMPAAQGIGTICLNWKPRSRYETTFRRLLMDKLPYPALLAAVLVTGIYGWLRQPPTQELAGMFIVSSVLLSGIYYVGKWGWRRWAPKPRATPKQAT